MTILQKLLILSILSGVFGSTVVFAAPNLGETIRGPANPARAAESTTPISEPLPTPNLTPEGFVQIRPGQLPPEMANIKFQLNGIRVINPVIFCEEELVEPFVCKFGQTITLGDVQTFANDITTRYQKAGYILTQVILPEQTIKKDGVITFQVVAGYIDQVTTKGIQPCVAELILKYGEAIQCSVPLHNKTLERYVLLTTDIPGVKVKAVITPSKTKVGASDLTFVGCQTLETANLNVNNINSKYLGPTQMILTGEQNSWFSAGDQIDVNLVSTGSEELNYGQFRYSDLLGSDGFRYNVLYREVHSRPGEILRKLNLRSFNKVYAFEFLYPYIRAREENLFLQSGFTVLDDRVNILRELLYHDRIRPIHATITYNKLDTLHGINSIVGTVTHGLKILNASEHTYISRPNGRSEFTKINWLASRTQALPCNFSLYAVVTGQYSLDPLLSVSQFSFGGRDIGRGYDPSEILGDAGVAGTVEMRYDVPFVPIPWVNEYITSTQFYAFYDAGKVWNVDLKPEPHTQDATSSGVGIRLNITECVKANFYVAKPLTKIVRANGNQNARGFFSISLALF